MTHMLTRHRDIQNWVTDRSGTPAIARIRNRLGEERAQLRLRFQRHDRPNQDEGVSPCSWTAWLAELDRQQLALRVGTAADDFALVDRSADRSAVN
jgi:hypothetical protein